MTNSCEIFTTEYKYQFSKKKRIPAEKIFHTDYFVERIEDWQIDPRVASIPACIDKEAEKLVRRHMTENVRSIYQTAYKNPWDRRKEEQGEKDYGSELIAYIRKLYFDAHDEKVLAQPATAKRVFGYVRPQFLHGGLSTYQDTHSRTGGTIMLKTAGTKVKMEETGTAK